MHGGVSVRGRWPDGQTVRVCVGAHRRRVERGYHRGHLPARRPAAQHRRTAVSLRGGQLHRPRGRAAARELITRGLATARKGYGTFVANTDTDAQGRRRVERTARQPAVLDLQSGQIPASAHTGTTVFSDQEYPLRDAARLLDHDPATPLPTTRTVIADTGGPVALRTTYRPGTHEPATPVDTITTLTSARTADPAEAHTLQYDQVLQHDQVHHTAGRPVLLIRTVARADTVRLADHHPTQP